MIVSTVLAWLLVAIAFVIAVPALWMLAQGLWPRMAGKSRNAAGKGIVLCALVGIVPAILVVIGVTVISKIPQAGVFAALFAGLALTWGFLGATGFATMIGERLWPELSHSAPWKQTRNGGLVIICCALLPVVGWFVLLPLIAIAGWGAHVLSWFARGGAPAQVAEQQLAS